VDEVAGPVAGGIDHQEAQELESYLTQKQI